MKKWYFSGIFWWLPAYCIMAQSGIAHVDVGVGPAAYRGDLNAGFRKWSAIYHVGLTMDHKKNLNGSFRFSFGTVTGQDATWSGNETGQTPNSYFKTTMFSFNYDLHINIVKRSNLAVYVSQGIGFMHYVPKNEFGENLIDQPNTRPENESYSTLCVLFPTKVGGYYLLSNNYGMNIEAGLFNPITDFIDNISNWGRKKGNDNILMIKFALLIPLPG